MNIAQLQTDSHYKTIIKMSQSKLEQEFLRKLASLKSSIALHDRGVMLGFILSFLPIFPAALFGFIVSAFNFRLCKAGKLDPFEEPLVKKSLILGAINTVLGIALLVLVIRFLSDVGWQHYLYLITDPFFSLLNKLPIPHKTTIGSTTV